MVTKSIVIVVWIKWTNRDIYNNIKKLTSTVGGRTPIEFVNSFVWQTEKVIKFSRTQSLRAW